MPPTTPTPSASPPPAPRPLAPLLIVAALIGAAAGIASFTFDYAQGLSYLSDDPKACINCHVMQQQYDGWMHGSHHANATCNDCHVPHDSLISKYYVKTEHGYRHSKGFTLNDFHEPIRITPASLEVVQGNCVRCHHDMVGGIGAAHVPSGQAESGCVHCHAGVGHGPAR